MPVNLPQRLINPEPNQKFLRGPLGMEGANAQGMGGGSGARRPGACRTGHLRRSWHAGCLRAGATDCPARARRCGFAISVTVKQRVNTQRHFVGHLLPAQGLGVPCAPGINDRRVTHKVCCVIFPEARRGHRRAGTSTVSLAVPPCQLRREAIEIWSGRRVTASPAYCIVAPARCHFSDSQPLERSGMMAG